jgi:hypothetical protein
MLLYGSGVPPEGYSSNVVEDEFSEVSLQHPAYPRSHRVGEQPIVAVVHKDALQRIGSDEDDPDEERLFRDLWEDETQREVVLESLKADCEVRTGRPPSL